MHKFGYGRANKRYLEKMVVYAPEVQLNQDIYRQRGFGNFATLEGTIQGNLTK